MKEVEITLIRYALSQVFGFKCSHPEEKVTTNREGKTYCKWCWRRLEVIRKRELKRIVNDFEIIPGSYKLQKTFLEPDEGLSQDQWREQNK